MEKNTKKKYLKVKKYTSGTQIVNSNTDPTTLYSNNRKQTVADMQFNNAEQANINKDVTKQKYQDNFNTAAGNFQDINAQNAANAGTTKAVANTLTTVAGDIPVVGAAVKAGTAISNAANSGKLNRMQKTNNSEAGKGYATLANVASPSSSLLKGFETGNTTDIVNGLTGGVLTPFLKGGSDAKKFEEQQYQKNRQDLANQQLNKYGTIDNTVQATQLKKGTSGIHIKPENKGKFNATKKATGKTTEELTHSSNPVTKKRAIFAQNAAKWHHEKGSKKVSARIIETEGREPIFSPKDKSGKRELVYYNPNDPTHKEGGVKAAVVKQGRNAIRNMLTVPEGSAIVTAKEGMNKEAIKAYKKGDQKTLNKVINKMPSDNKSKKDNGVYSLNKNKDNYEVKSPKTSFGVLDSDNNNTPDLGYGFVNKNTGENYSSLNNNVPISGSTTNTSSKSKTYKNSSLLPSQSNSLSSAIQSAPSIYNLTRGLLDKPKMTNRRYINNEGYKYQDLSNPNRRAANEQFRVESDNVRNATGGNGGSYLANQSLASANRFKNISDINNQENGRRLDIGNMNTSLKNQQNAQNLQLANQYDDQDLQNRARKNDFVVSGLTGLSDLSFNKEQMRNQASIDKIRANTLETNNFQYDPQTGQKIYKQRKGIKNLKIKKK